MRPRMLALASLLLLGPGLWGCALTPPPGSGTAPNNPLGSGRRLIVARVSSEDNRATAEAASALLLNALRDAGEVLGVREFLNEARSQGLDPWATSLIGRVQVVGWPTLEDARVLREAFGISTLVVIEVTAFEQVWGKYAKFTRAGVEASIFDIKTGRVTGRVARDVEIEEMRGRAFQFAMEQAVQDLADTLYPRTSFSIVNLWRHWRR